MSRYPSSLSSVTAFSIVFIFSIAAASAATFTINDATGGDCSLIGNWSSASKTCTLLNNLAIGDNITISGSGIVLDGNGKSMTGNGANAGDVSGVLVDSSSNVVVKNLVISSFRNGIFVNASDHVTVSGNGITIEGPFFTDRAAVLFRKTVDSTVSNNTITGAYVGGDIAARGHGFNIVESDRNELENNVIDMVRDGMRFNLSFENMIHHNAISNSGIEGIDFHHSANNFVYSNNFVDNKIQALNDNSCGPAFQDPCGNSFMNIGVDGNYWSDFDSVAEGCSDLDANQFCDGLYNIYQDDTFANVTASDSMSHISPLDLTPSQPPADGLHVAMICDTALCASTEVDGTPIDQPLISHISANPSVSVVDKFDDDNQSWDPTAYDAIVVSESIDPAKVSWLDSAAVPILSLEGYVNAASGATGFGLGTEGDSTTGDESVTVFDNTHEITSSFPTGSMVVKSGSECPDATNICNAGYVTGWANGVEPLAVYSKFNVFAKLVVVDKGDALVDGTPAPERRAIFAQSHFQDLNANGVSLFDKTFDWISYVGGQPGEDSSVTFSISVSNSQGTATLSDFQVFANGAAIADGTVLNQTGLYKINFTGPSNYLAAYSGGCADGTVRIRRGEAKTCSIVFSDATGTIYIHKILASGEPGVQEDDHSNQPDHNVSIDGIYIGDYPIPRGDVKEAWVPISVGRHHVTTNITSIWNFVVRFGGDCDENGFITVTKDTESACNIYIDDYDTTINGIVFYDVNENGIMDAGETGIEGWMVNLTDRSNNPVPRSLVVTDLTDADGVFALPMPLGDAFGDNKKWGNYTITQTNTTGWYVTSQNLAYNVSIKAALNPGLNGTISTDDLGRTMLFGVGRIAAIGNQQAQTPAAGSTSFTVTWTTDKNATTMLVYGNSSVSDANLDYSDPYFGYQFGTNETDLGENKTTSHSVTITGLSTGTYYYRVVSRASPASVGNESSFEITPEPAPAPAPAPTPSSGGGGGGGGGGGSRSTSTQTTQQSQTPTTAATTSSSSSSAPAESQEPAANESEPTATDSETSAAIQTDAQQSPATGFFTALSPSNPIVYVIIGGVIAAVAAFWFFIRKKPFGNQKYSYSSYRPSI